MCLRFIGTKGGRLSDQVAALDYAINKKVRISNNSFGGYSMATAELIAIERAQRVQHLFVASAGNDNKNVDDPR